MSPVENKGQVWLSTEEVCKFFGGLHPNTLRTWIKQGRVPSPVKRGKGNYYELESIKVAEQRMITRSMKNLRAK